MSESTTFDDLELLHGDDLKAVFDQMLMEEVVAALWGTSYAWRARLLAKLSRRYSVQLEKALAASERHTFEQVLSAQQKAVAIMCQMSRSGQIAYDAPEDMVA